MDGFGVGELVAVSESAEPAGAKWSLGIVRWMMVRQGKGYRIGVQTITRAAVPAAIRAVTGSAQDCRFRRAMLFADEAKRTCVLTDRGLFLGGRALELARNGNLGRVACGSLVEGAIGFDCFVLTGG